MDTGSDDMSLVSLGAGVFASDVGDTVVDEPTPQDVSDALDQDLFQIEANQPVATRKDAEDDLSSTHQSCSERRSIRH